MFGLKLNVRKTEYLTTDVNESGYIKIDGTERHALRCLNMGPAIASDGDLMAELTREGSLVHVAFADWRALRYQST
ncbi:unnamed protein product [Heligmosomoides polygyrus]|uniref:GCV_T domain-containing protein n=1 Tax=Heligmosomoides polygyrus TaxID=6339 RepID=A0A183GDK9_HELPZ|nr:unnamed protein product [Heligmosomoides polygyrus]